MDGNKKHFRQHDGRQRAKFNAYGQPLSIKKALYRLAHELDLLHASPLDARKVTTNVELRRDGEPRGDACMPADPGVAAYFKLHDKERVLACDKWDEIAADVLSRVVAGEAY